jgi:glycosyltransferase involved in cell wall biosynthesis
MMLEALAPLIRDGSVQVSIYGDGPERCRLEKICAEHGVSDGVCFHGWIKHENLQQLLVKDHAFVFPSIREFGGGVVLEAMALGLVPVVVDYGGPGELVTEKAGLAVPMGTREDIIVGVRAAVSSLIAEPECLASMRKAGLARVAEHFTWDAKASKTLEVYRWVTKDRDTSPESDPGFLSHSNTS